MQKKINKICFVSEVIESKTFAINCLYEKTEYFLSAVIGLTNSSQILHIT